MVAFSNQPKEPLIPLSFLEELIEIFMLVVNGNAPQEVIDTPPADLLRMQLVVINFLANKLEGLTYAEAVAVIQGQVDFHKMTKGGGQG